MISVTVQAKCPVRSSDQNKNKKQKKSESTTEYRHEFRSLKHSSNFLCSYGRKRHVKFGSVYLVKSPRFAQLLRYYVFSTTTGADHLFYFRTTNNSQISLYKI